MRVRRRPSARRRGGSYDPQQDMEGAALDDAPPGQSGSSEAADRRGKRTGDAQLNEGVESDEISEAERGEGGSGSDDEEEHEVVHLLDKRVSQEAGSRWDYLVEWEKYQPTWEPDCIVGHLVELIEALDENLRELREGEDSGCDSFTTVYDEDFSDYESPRKAQKVDNDKTAGRAESEFRDELLDLERYPEDHPDPALAGMPMSQPEDPEYKPLALQGAAMEPYRELGLDKAESDGDGEELWFERQGDLDLDEERELRNEIPGLGVLESRVEVNDLAERVKDKSQAYPPARGRDVRDRVRSRRCEMLAVVDRYTRILERERERLAERLAPIRRGHTRASVCRTVRTRSGFGTHNIDGHRSGTKQADTKQG